MDLIVNLIDEDIQIYDPNSPSSVLEHSGALIAGARTRSYVVDPRQRASVVGAHFRPGGAFPFLGVSPSELVDAHVRLEDLWGCDGPNLREQLIEASSPEQRFRLIEAALLRRLRRARAGHVAVAAGLAAFRARANDVRVADVASLVGLSRRHFIEVFETEVGLTPKLYARLQRFHSVKKRIAHGAPASWATFAVEHGYFDQSHMIREFVEFSGISPTDYLRGASGETALDHLVHVYQAAQGTARTP
jgi:AraC-like DNA-binding protein